MYALTGITGKVGGAMGRKLIAEGAPVRAVVRDRKKAAAWSRLGCDVAVAEMQEADALTAAFGGAEGVFILPPSDFDPEPGYPEARSVIDAVVKALRASRPKKVVCLSTIGADAKTENLLTQRTLMEDALREIDLPVTFLRPAWFMENAAWDVASARDEGVFRSFLQPLDKPIPMVATRDIGNLAADLIRQEWNRSRIVQLEGPSRVSPNNLASAFALALGRDIRTEAIPRDSWQALFVRQGMRNPTPRMRMLDGFNEGWIDFPANERDSIKGSTPIAEVINMLVAHS
jgi:uncharacterized protein YbjT (DUF2867 family)